MKNLSDQQKGSLMAFVAVMFITPDSLFIRLSNVETWGLVFYRGIIPFVVVFFGKNLFTFSFSIFFGSCVEDPCEQSIATSSHNRHFLPKAGASEASRAIRMDSVSCRVKAVQKMPSRFVKVA